MKSFISSSRKHDISFHHNGRIDISAHLAKRLSLSPGDVIDILKHQGEWYICVKLRAGTYIGRHIGKVWHASGHKGTFRTQAKPVTNAILAELGNPKSFHCPVGEDFIHDNMLFITIIYKIIL